MPIRPILRLLLVLAALCAARGAAAAEPDVIAVRTGEHAAFSRVVFDWQQPVTAEISRQGEDTLVVTFGRPATFDLTKAPTRKLKRVAAIKAGEDGRSFEIDTRGAVTYKLGYDGTKVFVDVISPQADAGAPKKIKKKETIGTLAVAKPDIAGLEFQRADVTEPAGGDATQTDPAASDHLAAPAGPPPELIGPLPSPLFDIAAWRGGDDFLKAYREATAGLASPENTESLLKVARLQFAWRHGDEGLTMLQRLIQKEPALARRADIAALKEALALLAARPADLTNVFSSPRFDGNPEALLWRGATEATGRRWEQAAGSFAAGLQELNKYPAGFKTDLALAAAEAGLRADDTDLARKALKLAENNLADPAALAEWNALKGLLLIQDKDTAGAEPYLSAAAAADALRPRVMAQLALIEIGQKSGDLSPADAATELEGLTYIWQGDDLQLEILDRLIDTQAWLGRYDRALEAADAAILAAPDAGAQRGYRRRLAKLLESALDASSTDGADRVSRIALFQRYGDMLPDQEQRADLGLRLADQLAAADLQAQALGVLRELKRNAPDSKQPAIEARLAKLSATQDSSVEAVGEPSALNTPAAGEATDPDRLWRSKRWSEAADGYLKAIAQPSASEGRPRQILRAAAALMLAGRNSELAGLRDAYSNEIKDSATAELFSRLTAPGADYTLLIAPEVARALTASP